MNPSYNLSTALDEAVAGLDFHETSDLLKNEPSINMRRRRRRPTEQDQRFVTVTLTQDADGVLRWEEGLRPFSSPGRRMRRGPGIASAGETVKQLKFEKLNVNEIWQMLQRLDDKLTPNHGKLRRLLGMNNQGEVQWQEIAQPEATSQRILVFIHGTFSSNDNVVGKELAGTPEGQKLLADLLKNKGKDKIYDEVLAFDHPTLSVSPLLNALELSRRFSNTKATVDVICHSRGGLVTRWWLEVMERSAKPGKVIFVGSPLGGTSLADPARLRGSLEYFANLGNTLAKAGSLFSVGNPFLTGAAGLVKIVSSITGLGAKLPLFDAAIAMIPGLAAQSRVGNNLELSSLRRKSAERRAYYAVKANFEPKDLSLWRFWEAFVDQPKMRAVNTGVDFIFSRTREGRKEPDENECLNDLVVNTQSMMELFADEDATTQFRAVQDFKTTDKVHHCNYFRQSETLAFIRKSLHEPDA